MRACTHACADVLRFAPTGVCVCVRACADILEFAFVGTGVNAMVTLNDRLGAMDRCQVCVPKSPTKEPYLTQKRPTTETLAHVAGRALYFGD